jgi:hypothetical protein
VLLLLLLSTQAPLEAVSLLRPPIALHVLGLKSGHADLHTAQPNMPASRQGISCLLKDYYVGPPAVASLLALLLLLLCMSAAAALIYSTRPRSSAIPAADHSLSVMDLLLFHC